ncbi:MAG: redoxin family protein [Pseudobacteriovorax sp.]|nr:redoxin family protein [Pseudobacteriovorax sp.]
MAENSNNQEKPSKRSKAILWLRDGLILLCILAAVEVWQGWNHPREPLDSDLQTKVYPTLQEQTAALWTPDKPALVYAFAPWCSVCQNDASVINPFLGDERLHVVSLALSWDATKDLIDFQKDTGLASPILLGSDDEVQALGLTAFPSYYLIDKNGAIVHSWSGFTTRVGLWLRIKTLL